MKKLLTTIAVLVALFPTSALAQQDFTRVKAFTNPVSTNKQNMLEGVALDSGSSVTVLLTHDKKTTGNAAYSKALVGIFYTYAAASTVTLAWSCSLDGTNFPQKTSGVVTSGVRALSAFSDSWTTNAADADFMAELDVRGCKKLRIVVGGAGAGATDLVDVQVTAVVGN